MFEDSFLFWLILGILAMITACLLLIAYEMSRRDVGSRILRAKNGSNALNECAFYFGFLSEQPLGRAIPEECFGCTLALSCIKAVKPSGEESVKKKVAPVSSVTA